ncbi:MAG: addiction module antidote protein, HigA family [Spirochaetaceae bacterium]|nr:MAG: addiction module antidote protein, HigA family [Spirochaetaceae bacterium]
MTGAIPTPTIGEILQEEFLQPLAMTPYRLSKELHVSTSTVLDLVHGKRRLTTDMALRLSKLFGTSERFWINLQTNIDVRNRKPEMEPELEKIQPVRTFV